MASAFPGARPFGFITRRTQYCSCRLVGQASVLTRTVVVLASGALLVGRCRKIQTIPPNIQKFLEGLRPPNNRPLYLQTAFEPSHFPSAQNADEAFPATPVS